MSALRQTSADYASRLQQIPLNFEPRELYQPHKRAGRFALCSKPHGAKRVTQEIFDVSNLDWVVGQVENMPERHQQHFWISQATLTPWATNRRISSIMLLNAVWVDIDIAHPPKGFDQSTLFTGTPERLAETLAFQIEQLGWPAPSYIISTGGGLCAKYLFDDAMPSVARARWQSLQRHFVAKIGELDLMGHKWPVDHAASDAARILRLVGTHNPRWNAPCRIVWESGKRYDFDYLADYMLPYSRDQIREHKANRALFKGWDDNRAKASAEGIRRSVTAQDDPQAAINAAMSDECARSLWCSRFEFGRAVLESRGGVQEGSRNNHFWPMANAIAYSCTGADQLTKELASLHQSFFKSDGWTQGEAMQTAAQVVRRIKKGELYKMKTATFLEKMEVSSSELETFGGLLGSSRHNKNAKKDEWDIGVMGFEKMKGLELDAFVEETRRRQALAGVRSAEVRSTTKPLDLKEKAILMRSSGCTTRQIAAEIGISQKTASRWTQSV